MGYSLYIERDDGEITLEEWVSAVSEIDTARINSEGVEAKNPRTGEVIKISGNPGDVEVLEYQGGFLGIGRKVRWVYAISFFEGRASFKATGGIDNPNNPIHIVVTKLANHLNAKIVGAEGEEYLW